MNSFPDNVRFLLACMLLLGFVLPHAHAGAIGKPGAYAVYEYQPDGIIPASVVQRLVVTLGDVAVLEGREYQWYRLEARKANGQQFSVWLLTDGFPSAKLAEARITTARYILREGNLEPLEYVHMFTGEAVLPTLGFWQCLLPRAADEQQAMTIFSPEVKYLGLPMTRTEVGTGQAFAAPQVVRLELPGDLLIGTIYTTRGKDKTRRRSGKEFRLEDELVPYEREDYPERFTAGQTIFTILANHQDLVVRRNVFYMDMADPPYPESLYRSNYLGPYPGMLDEPGVRAWSERVEPALRQNPALGKDFTPQYMLDQFLKLFREDNYHGRPTQFIANLRAREDVDTGDMPRQSAMFTWEVIIDSGAMQLADALDGPPDAIVYEGRLCTDRDLPFFDSIAGIQIPTNDQRALLDIYIASLRGAARTTGKKWGFSIYRGQQIGEIHNVLKYAYDTGSSYFLFWTGEIPYAEQLDYSRYVWEYARAHPDRDMAALRRAGEVMILYPPGYTFLQFGLGRMEPMWRAPLFNLEQQNRFGLKYRRIIHNIGMEIERCYRLGICYDLAWDIDGLDLSGYREVVRVKEDGTIEVTGKDNEVIKFNESRPVMRPDGNPPALKVTLSATRGTAPLAITATAEITEVSAPVYFTSRFDDAGVWRNDKVIWQLYGPGDLYYGPLNNTTTPGTIHGATCNSTFKLTQPGAYRLRASVVDRAGRSTEVWQEITVE